MWSSCTRSATVGWCLLLSFSPPLFFFFFPFLRLPPSPLVSVFSSFFCYDNFFAHLLDSSPLNSALPLPSFSSPFLLFFLRPSSFFSLSIRSLSTFPFTALEIRAVSSTLFCLLFFLSLFFFFLPAIRMLVLLSVMKNDDCNCFPGPDDPSLSSSLLSPFLSSGEGSSPVSFFFLFFTFLVPLFSPSSFFPLPPPFFRLRPSLPVPGTPTVGFTGPSPPLPPSFSFFSFLLFLVF